MRRAAKIDANQKEIVAGLRNCGYSVLSLAAVGEGCPDLIVGAAGKNYLIEVKDGNKSPSRRVLTQDQRKFHATWQGQACVVKDLDEALAFISCG